MKEKFEGLMKGCSAIAILQGITPAVCRTGGKIMRKIRIHGCILALFPAIAAAAGPAQPRQDATPVKNIEEKRCWKKGTLHTHSLWSDGRTLPEVDVKTYQNLGYDFMCLSDHNIFQQKNFGDCREVRSEEGPWPPALSAAELQRSQKLFPGEIDVFQCGVRRFVRLKSFKELEKRFSVKGRFLLLPGVEITHMNATDGCGEYYDWHANVINLPEELTPCPAKDSVESFRRNYAQYRKAASRHPSMESMFVLNHPFSSMWDVSPLAAIENPEIRFFEVCNGGGAVKEASPMITIEKYWDFILAHRIIRRQPLIYGIASDDAHFYDPARIGQLCGCGHGWVMVDCPGDFTANRVVRRMKEGKFYASCGVLLDDFRFDEKTKTLHVKVRSEKNVRYRIEFVTTKRGFDRTVRMKKYPHPQHRFSRRLPVIPDSIGVVVHSAEGTEASYAMKDDDLYIRAVIRSNIPYEFRSMPFAPKTKCAWVQPVVCP